MTRRDWWIGIMILVVVLLFQALFPRYEWRQIGGAFFARIDRWTGDITRHLAH